MGINPNWEQWRDYVDSLKKQLFSARELLENLPDSAKDGQRNKIRGLETLIDEHENREPQKYLD